MEIIQRSDQAVDVADWLRVVDEYPEGALPKTLLYCLNSEPYDFLKNTKYLFKRSPPKYPEQFWMEIFAYRLGLKMDIPVPPAFVAYDSKVKQSGALIEWFVSPWTLLPMPPNQRLSVILTSPIKQEIYVPGGDYCQQYIPDFDRKDGTQHNFGTVSKIFETLGEEYPVFEVEWENYWANIFLFDALIGNTDRHQDNWGNIVTAHVTANYPRSDSQILAVEKICIAPVFDNGSSMGRERLPSYFKKINGDYDEDKFKKYISKGHHHMKWSLEDTKKVQHAEMLKKIADKYPETHSVMLNSLKKVNDNAFKTILDDLVAFDVPDRLTRDRADFMLELINRRQQYLLDELGN